MWRQRAISKCDVISMFCVNLGLYWAQTQKPSWSVLTSTRSRVKRSSYIQYQPNWVICLWTPSSSLDDLLCIGGDRALISFQSFSHSQPCSICHIYYQACACLHNQVSEVPSVSIFRSIWQGTSSHCVTSYTHIDTSHIIIINLILRLLIITVLCK